MTGQAGGTESSPRKCVSALVKTKNPKIKGNDRSAIRRAVDAEACILGLKVGALVRLRGDARFLDSFVFVY